MRNVIFNNIKELSYGKREAFNTLRTNLSFCGAGIKVVVFTSSLPDEGKSTTVMELARSIAADNKKVIVLDCDLRKSVFESHYRITTDVDSKSADTKKRGLMGMSHYLTGQCSIDSAISHNTKENFDIILAGRTTPTPTELLNTELFDELINYCRDNYDYVLIDAPPIGSVIDAAIIAPKTDGIVYVIEYGVTSRNLVLQGKRQLELTGVRILGAVLNKVNTEKGGKGYYYKGYYSNYYGGQE
jgi:capsular exopolysaccharide synthesis family protein